MEYRAFSLTTGKPSESAKVLPDLATAFNSSIVVKKGENSEMPFSPAGTIFTSGLDICVVVGTVLPDDTWLKALS